MSEWGMDDIKGPKSLFPNFTDAISIALIFAFLKDA